MTLRFVATAAAVLVLVFLAPHPAGAQSYHGRIRGAVQDADGRHRRATVVLAEDATDISRATTTNERGEYVFPDVLPGTYRLTVSAPGFKQHERRVLRIGTQSSLTIDVPLEIGDVTERVVVEAPAAAVETTGASVAGLLDRGALERLPSAGRNLFIMGTTLPTVIATGDAQFVRQQDQSNSSLISLGGGPRRDNAYVVDGVPIVDILNRATFIPAFDAVEEMQVQLSPYDAQVGRTSGGVFNVTARSGTNAWRGAAFYQTRPDWGQSRLFFADKHDLEGPDTYYHLYGGSLGGPIARNRTFVWANTEGYRTATSRNTVLVLPTEAERRGDFSRSGVTIYDPLTTRPDPAHPGSFIRDPFPGNQIPAARLNPVAVALLQHLPQPTQGNSRPAVADIVDRADQVTGKVTHRWSEAATSSALYAWYQSMEPDAKFYGGRLFGNGADPGDGALVRQVDMVALNTVWATRSRLIVDGRYGFTSFLDDNRPAAFDPSSLGFAPAFLNAVPLRKFPSIGVTDYGRGGSLLGDREQQKATYYSHVASGSVSTSAGRHTLKAGGEYRTTGVRFLNIGGMGGYTFQRDFTLGPNPNAPAPGTGNAFAAFLLGFPSSGGISVSSPLDVYLRYGSGFAQDEVRVTPRLTLSLGLRYEFETGLRERDNRMAVGWASGESFPVPVPGLSLTGGLRYAGVDGAPAHQGDPNPWQLAPRVGVAYAANDRTILRGGYGIFWAPTQGISADEIGSGTPGFNQTTSYIATGANPFMPCAGCSLTNPFPAGITPPRGGSAGRLTSVGSSIWFVDPDSRLAHVHRYSVDVERELRGGTSVSVGYMGARGVDLTGGVSGGPININQLEPRYAALGNALFDPVPNPFLGTPLATGILAGPTVPRGQLLRPYPQFDTVYRTRASVARSRFDALVVSAARRPAGRWGGRASYTWSRFRDSQWAESNFFSGGSGLIDNHDIEREYQISVTDTPHRLTLVGMLQLPFDVTVSAAGSLQSGFPVSVVQTPNNSNLFGSAQRPHVVPGAEPLLTRDPADSYDPACGCIRWLNPAAWSQAAPFTFGNVPRTDARVRTPGRRLFDVAVEKSQRLGSRTVSLRAEIINVFNIADFRGPGIAFGDSSFGQIREAAGFPRMVQVLARLAW